MQKTFTLLALIAICIGVKAQNKALTAGNIVIYRVGDGKKALANTATPVFLDERSYNLTAIPPTSTIVQSIAIPGDTTSSKTIAPNHILTASGTATSEGLITRSVDGNYLVFTGYEACTDTSKTKVAGSAGNVTRRVIGRLGGDGVLNTTTALKDYASGNNPRSAITVDGKNFLFAGGTGGIKYAVLGDTTISNWTASVYGTKNTAGAPSNIRAMEVYNGQLYVSTQATQGATPVRIAAIGTGVQSDSLQKVVPLDIDSLYPSLVAKKVKTSPYQFVMCTLKGGNVIYIADDGVDSIAERGIQKYSLVGTKWTYNGSFHAKGATGLTGINRGDSVLLFATSAKKLFLAVDVSGYNVKPAFPSPYSFFTDSAIVIDSASTNTAFRGIAFAPGIPSIPNPVSFKSPITASLINSNAKISWSTASEVNTSTYIIEKSTDSKNYSVIGEVSAKNAPSSYSYIDKSKAVGVAYYRIKILDKNGSYTYSRVVSVNANIALSVLAVYPNPVVNNFILSHPIAGESAFIKITTIEGKMLASYAVEAGASQTSVDASRFTKGAYFVTYQNNGNTSTTQFVK